MKTKIVLLPLDERPCNYEFPMKLFSHDKVEIVRPKKLGNKKTPASFETIVEFLREECKDASGLVVSMDMLLYGGLIPSRLHHEEKETLLERIKILKEIRESNKNLIIYAFQVIMRCPDYSSDDEEPDYYRIYGKEINELGVAVHKSRLGIESDVPVKTAMEKVDPKCLDDYISRREINRYMNVETLQMARDGLTDALVIPQDDSSKYGYAAIDQKEIREKISEYNMEDKVLMYPGADEVELTLLARMLNVLAGRQPKVYVKYTSEMAKNIIPLYEGCTLANTVKYHILSAGCLATESYESADIVLFMTAPAGGMEEAMEQPSEKLEYCVERNIAEMFELLKYCISQKKIVTIADNAYANGGDLGIVKILNNNHLLMKVDGYAGWNTSANTLGTAIAEGVDSYLNKVTEEHQRFLAERYVEDAGYCSVVRKSVTEKLPESMNYFDVGNEKEARTPENFYHGLILGLIVTLRDRYRIVSNRESGRGRYDIAMYPLEKNQDAFLMEFKVWDKKKEKNLEETVESAFRQIEEKKYVTDLVTAGINEERIYKLGFAFAGKEVLVKEKI